MIGQSGHHLYGGYPIGDLWEQNLREVQVVFGKLTLWGEHDIPGIALQMDVHIREGWDHVLVGCINLDSIFGNR